MKLLINTATTSKGGSVQVAKSFIEECKKFAENTYHVIIGPSLHNLIKEEDYPDNFFFYHINYRPATRVFSFKSTSSFFRKIEESAKPDVVFTTSGPAYWRPNTSHLVGYNLPHYIYEDSPFFQIISKIERYEWLLRGKLIKYFFKRDADAYVVQTNDVKKRLIGWLNNNKPVYTVSNTCSQNYFNYNNYKKKLPPPGKNEFRLLLLSSYYHHKNFELIKDIIDKMSIPQKKNTFFIVTLNKEDYHKVFNEAYRNNVINTGPIPPQEGPSLYQECDAMFLPSLLECFSASYPEAMAMEKPIITVDLGFAHSICNDSALFFNPIDSTDALNKIEALRINADLRKNLILKGKKRLEDFPSSKERAVKYLEICEEISK